MFRKLLQIISGILILICLAINISFPIYLVTATLIIQSVLPTWYYILNVVGSGIGIISLIGLVFIYMYTPRE